MGEENFTKSSFKGIRTTLCLSSTRSNCCATWGESIIPCFADGKAYGHLRTAGMQWCLHLPASWPSGKWVFVGTSPLIFHWEKNTGSQRWERKSELTDTDPRKLPDQYLKEWASKGKPHSLSIHPLCTWLLISSICYLLPGFSLSKSAAPSSPLIIFLCSIVSLLQGKNQGI